LGQPRKSDQTHPKNQQKWVGLGNWMSMVSKKRKPMKINGFRVKLDPNPKKLTYLIMLMFFIIIFIG